MPPGAQDKEKSRSRATEADSGAGEAQESEEIRGFLPDLVRRTLTLGFTGLFLTEEAVRKAFGDTVPREWNDFVMAQSERTRTELVERLSRELGRAVTALDPVELLRRLFEGQTLEVTARIHFPAAEKSPGDAGASGRRRDESEADEE